MYGNFITDYAELFEHEVFHGKLSWGTLKLRILCIMRVAATEWQHLRHICKALIRIYRLIRKIYGKDSKSFTHPFNFRTTLNLKWQYNATHNLYSFTEKFECSNSIRTTALRFHVVAN